MKVLQITAILAAAAAMGCSSESPLAIESDPAFGLGNAGMVPFTANEQSTPAGGVVCPPGAFGSNFTDTGNATHLGEFTGEHWVCSQFVPSPPPFTFVMVSSEGVRVAADGDSLWFRLNPVLGGRTVLQSFDPGATLTSTAALDIIGGTGRFEGATGLVNVLVESRVGAAPPIPARMDGVISSVGSK